MITGWTVTIMLALIGAGCTFNWLLQEWWDHEATRPERKGDGDAGKET